MHRRRQDVIFYGFDLLWHDGEDLRTLPLVERKRRLRRLIKGRAGLLFTEQIQGSGVRSHLRQRLGRHRGKASTRAI
jgi:bifunctional non-homologous end joining protein LigD